MFALVHRSCGHLGGVANHRPLLVDQQRILQGAGYFQWRVRQLDPDVVEAAVTEVHSDARADCITCRVDPLRGLLPDSLKAAAEATPIDVVRR